MKRTALRVFMSWTPKATAKKVSEPKEKTGTGRAARPLGIAYLSAKA
jgi:hypothetical protein